MIRPSPFLIPAAFAAGCCVRGRRGASGARCHCRTAPGADAAADRPRGHGPGRSGSSQEPLGERLNRTDGVLHPPRGVDPGVAIPPPSTGSSMPVIPPPGTPGGNPAIEPKYGLSPSAVAVPVTASAPPSRSARRAMPPDRACGCSRRRARRRKARRPGSPRRARAGAWRPVIAARNDLRDTETMTGRPNSLASAVRARASTRSEASGRRAEKQPHAGIEDQPLARDAGAFEARDPLGEKSLDAPPDLVGPEIERLAPARRLPAACMTTRRHDAAARSGYSAGSGKPRISFR